MEPYFKINVQNLNEYTMCHEDSIHDKRGQVSWGGCEFDIKCQQQVQPILGVSMCPHSPFGCTNVGNRVHP